MIASVAARCPMVAGSPSAFPKGISSRAAAVPAPLRFKNVIRPESSSRRGAVVVRAAADALNTVKVVVQGRHMQVTTPIREYAENKVNKVLHNFEGSVKEVDVTLSTTGNHGKGNEAHHARNQTAEVTVYTLRHGVIRVEDTEDDLYAAIDLVTDKLKRKMSKVKEKAIQRNTWPGRGGSKGGTPIGDLIDAEASDSELPTDGVAAVPQEIVREKVLMLGNKMTTEEAMEQLEAVGHDFFVFLDAADGQMKVVYRRRYHGYGLLIPTIHS